MYRKKSASDSFASRAAANIAPLPRRLLLALSGGPDSVALLHLLLEAHKNVEAVHCNFHIRGEEAMRDEMFCRELCGRLSVPLTVINFDAPEVARKTHKSLELVCRDLRYTAFSRIMKERGIERIAVAHHADDNVETFLLNLMRGAGIAGLTGMEADNGQVARPLLDFTRDEILGYLESKGEKYVVDSTNSEDEASRNFLRNRMIPLLETRWPAARKKIATTIANLRGVEKTYNAALAIPEPGFLDNDTYFHAPSPADIMHKFAKAHCVPAILEKELNRAMKSEVPGQRWKVDSGELWKSKKGLVFIPKDNSGDSIPSATETVISPAEMCPSRDELTVYLPENMDCYEWKIIPCGEMVRPLGMRGLKRVATILKEAGIPPSLRSKMPGLYRKDNGKLIWIPGVKRSDEDSVDSSKTRIYALKLDDPASFLNKFNINK